MKKLPLFILCFLLCFCCFNVSAQKTMDEIIVENEKLHLQIEQLQEQVQKLNQNLATISNSLNQITNDLKEKSKETDVLPTDVQILQEEVLKARAIVKEETKQAMIARMQAEESYKRASKVNEEAMKEIERLKEELAACKN